MNQITDPLILFIKFLTVKSFILIYLPAMEMDVILFFSNS